MAVPAVANTPDSLGVKEINGHRFVIHKVQQGEGYYALHRRYGVEVEQIRQANPDLGLALPLGALVLVPLEALPVEVLPPSQTAELHTQVEIPTPEFTPLPVVDQPIRHRVNAGETLYSLARRYNVAVEDLRKWNRLPDNNIQPNQELVIRQKAGDKKPKAPEEGQPMAILIWSDHNYATTFDSLKWVHGTTQKQVKQVQQTVVASNIVGGPAISNKFLALHATAPSGTIIRLVNPMNHRIAFVKVVGSLPARNPEGSQIKITKALADKLGVLDTLYQLEAEYYELVKAR